MLKSYKVPKQEIALSGGQVLTVRGLSLSDILQLVRRFKPELEGIFSIITSGELDIENTAQLAFAAIQSAPELVAYGVALAADEPDASDVVLTLPLDVQVAALEAIATLTFSSGGGVKKMLEAVVRMMQGLNQTAESLTSNAGFGDSEGK